MRGDLGVVGVDVCVRACVVVDRFVIFILIALTVSCKWMHGFACCGSHALRFVLTYAVFFCAIRSSALMIPQSVRIGMS